MAFPSLTKVALVTGAAKRIGAEIAHSLHNAGYQLVLHYNESVAEAKHLCTKLNQIRQDSAIMCKADLTQDDEIGSLIPVAISAFGRLDVLVNNASCFYPTDIVHATESEWDKAIAVNLKAPFFLTQSAIKPLTESQGVIINITDIHADKPLKGHAIYCISKSGLVMLTKAFARDLGPHIRVNAIAPGAISWPEGQNSLSADLKEMIIQQTALKRSGHPQDIANAVLYFAQASFVTGQVLMVDGGRSLK